MLALAMQLVGVIYPITLILAICGMFGLVAMTCCTALSGKVYAICTYMSSSSEETSVNFNRLREIRKS
jgi:hypothetical protein